MIKTERIKELIQSIDKTTKALEKLNKELDALKKCRYTDEEKQNLIDCVRAYCLVNGIRVKVCDVDSDNTCFYYHYMDKRPIKRNGIQLHTTINWNRCEEIDACLDSVVVYIRNHVVPQM
jgi:hypothetical protein